MRIAIIGGAGFIGTRLTARLLAEGHQVAIGDKVNSDKYPELSVICDIRDEDSLRQVLKGCDIVYNLAAEHHDNVSPVSLYHDVNVKGSEKLLNIASENNIKKVVYTSSVAVYGFCDHEGEEATPFNPFNQYGKSKAESEKYYIEWANQDSSRMLTILRPTAVFGENNRGNIYNLLRQVASGLFLMIGDGKNRKSIAYVENIAKALQWSMEQGSGTHIFNYIDKPDMDMNELVSVIRKSLGKSGKPLIRLPYFIAITLAYCFTALEKITKKSMPISPVRVQKFTAETIFSAKKIHGAGFTPEVTLAEGLQKTIEYEFLD